MFKETLAVREEPTGVRKLVKYNLEMTDVPVDLE